MSVVELSVTMMIMGIVIAATATLVIGVQRTNAQTINRLDQIESARNSVERMSRTLRAAVMPSQLLSSCAGCIEDAFIRGEDYQVQFYSNIDNPGNSVGPSRVTYQVVETSPGVGDLVQTIQVPDSPVPTPTGYVYCDSVANPTPACLARVKKLTIARGVLIDSAVPMLSYYDRNGAQLLTAGGALTAGQLAAVLSIELSVSVQEQGSARALPTQYVQRIMLPNAQAVIRQTEEEETP
jgi:type II secretory pathway pseudopilin PulG